MKLLYCLSLCFLVLIFACDTTKTVMNSNYDTENIIVLLKNDVTDSALEKEFSNYELRSKRKISRSENRFMFTYNTSKIAADKLLTKIKRSDKVVEAEFAELVRTPKVSDQ